MLRPPARIPAPASQAPNVRLQAGPTLSGDCCPRSRGPALVQGARHQCSVSSQVGEHCYRGTGDGGLLSSTLPALALNRQVEQVSPRSAISALGPRYPSVSHVPRWNCYVRLDHKTTLPHCIQLQSRRSLSWSVIFTTSLCILVRTF